MHDGGQMTRQQNTGVGPVADGPADEPLLRLRAERELALETARSAIRDTTRLTRLLAILSEPGPLDLLLDRALATLSELFSADIVVLLDPAGTGSFAPLAAIGLPEDMLRRSFSDHKEAYPCLLMETREPILVNNAGLDPQVDESLAELEVMTLVGLPVAGNLAVRGALFLARCRPEPFSGPEADLLTNMAHRMGLALEEAQRASQLSRIVESGRLISRHLNPGNVASESVQLFPAIAGADGAALILVSPELGASCAGLNGLDWACTPFLLQLTERLLAQPARIEPISVIDLPALLDHHGLMPWPDCPKTALVLPIGRKERNRGLLLALRKTAVAFTPSTLQMATLFTDQISAAMENARLYQAVHSELTERMRAEEALRASEERFRALIRSVSDIIAILDPAGTIRYISPAAETLWACPVMALYGQSLHDRAHPDDAASLRDLFAHVGTDAGTMLSGSVRLQQDGENWRDFDLILVNLLNDPVIGGIVATLHDVTERKIYERQLSQLAYYDPLTGLANRACFKERLQAALVRAERTTGSVAVLFADLDNFKVINDTLGHAYGDEALRLVADRLRACTGDGEMVARLGGDEFTVLIEGVGGVEQVTPLADRLVATLGRPIRFEERDYFIGGSLGVAISDPRGDSGDELLRKADLAMYQAKQEGKGRYVVFHAGLDETVKERLELAAGMRRALRNGEFFLRYQPIFTLDERRVQAVEALVFWRHPIQGEIVPSVIIPLAEEIGCMAELGPWVLGEACRQGQRWQSPHPDGRGVSVCVNLSPGQFHSPNLTTAVAAALDQANLPAGRLVLEIAESTLAQEPAAAVDRLMALKKIGVRLAIDDFGTGYLGVHALKRLPVDALKIEHTFIDGIEADERKQAIVRSVLALAGNQGLQVIGEGIETQAQAAQLWQLGCGHGQGRLLARPLSAEACAALLSRQG